MKCDRCGSEDFEVVQVRKSDTGEAVGATVGNVTGLAVGSLGALAAIFTIAAPIIVGIVGAVAVVSSALGGQAIGEVVGRSLSDKVTKHRCKACGRFQ